MRQVLARCGAGVVMLPVMLSTMRSSAGGSLIATRPTLRWRLLRGLCSVLVLVHALGVQAESGSEQQVESLRAQEISEIRRALDRRQAPNRLVELSLRLAELYLESYRARVIEEGRAYEARLATSREARLDRSRSRPELQKGIAALEAILKHEKSGVRNAPWDRVYYLLAFNTGELDQTDVSRGWFERLIREYPDSPFAGEAYRELGDREYEKQNFAAAQKLYAEASRRDLGTQRPRVLNRLAWTYYRTRQFPQAIAAMKEAITIARKDQERFLSVRSEALRDMAIFMVEGSSVEETLAYFREAAGVGSGAELAALFEKLAERYERNAEYVPAARVYEALLAAGPDAETAFRARVKLFEMDLRGAQYGTALKRFLGQRIVTASDEASGATALAARNLRSWVRRTGTEQHERFRQEGARLSLRIAEAYYEAYLERFLKVADPREETPEILMYLAEVKRELGKWSDAAQLYRRVLESSPKAKGDAPSPYRGAAIQGWIVTLSEALKREQAARAQAAPSGRAQGAGSVDDAPAAPSAIESDFVRAADLLEQLAPGSVEAREAQLRAAQIQAGYPSTRASGVERAARLAERAAETPQGQLAARLWIQTLADQLPPLTTGQSAESSEARSLGQAIARIRKHPTLLQSRGENSGMELARELEEQERRLKVGAIVRSERERDFKRAGQGYEDLARAAKQPQAAEKAYASAIGSFVRAREYPAIQRVADDWLRRYPKSSEALDTVRAGATSALIDGEVGLSGGLFETIGVRTYAPEPLLTSAQIFEGSGNVVQARRNWQQYLESYPKHAARPEVMLRLGKSFQAEGMVTEAMSQYESCLAGSEPERSECGARLADLYLERGDTDRARALFARVAAFQAPAGAAAPFIGYARFRVAQLLERSRAFLPLELPEARLRRALDQRLAFLTPLSQAYLRAMEAGGPWGVAALDRLAQFADRFASEVESIPPADTQNPAEIANFERALRAVSDPLQSRAIQTWLDAYRRAQRYELLSPFLPRIVDRLVEARTSGVFRAQGTRGRLRIAGTPADGGEEGRLAALRRVRARLKRNPKDAVAWIDYGNLLWGESRHLLARVAYARALEIDPRSPNALNNLGVVIASGAGQEDWYRAAEAQEYWRRALKIDPNHLPAKINRAQMLNYYRLFAKARELWEQVLTRVPGNIDAIEGLGVAFQGLGMRREAEIQFVRAESEGKLSPKRFTRLFFELAQAAAQETEGVRRCLFLAPSLERLDLQGFEREAFESARRFCEEWQEDRPASARSGGREPRGNR